MFPKVETVFSVNGMKRNFPGAGQSTAQTAQRAVPGKRSFIKLIGFNIDGKFKAADLSISSKNPLSAG